MTYDATERVYQRLLAEQRENIRRFERHKELYPLSHEVLWEAPEAECDQWRAARSALEAPVVSLTLGGWRSGKSQLYKCITVAMALGSTHPMVQKWIRTNNLPENCIPEGPAQVYAIAQSSNDSLRYHRGDFEKLVGKDRIWLNKDGKGEARVILDVPGFKDKGQIWFKSIDQERRSYQGITIRWAWIDEEPLGDIGYGVYDELRARVADQDGKIGISMIPMEGITWVDEKLVQGRDDDARTVYLDTLHNPHLPKKRFEALFAGMDEDERAQRQHGRFRARTGAVYNLFQMGDGDRHGPGHMCDDFPIPEDWVRVRSGDFGLVHPTAVYWGAIGDDNTLYVYREYYEPNGPSYGYHAENCARLEGRSPEDDWAPKESIEAGIGDPAAKEGREEFARYGMPMAPADNDIKAGIDSIKRRLRIQPDNRPRIKIFRSCRDMLREVPGYVWDPNRKDEVPVKKHDHSCDALRYMCRLLDEWDSISVW